MPTTIITGRDITFTIDGDDFDAQATSATLTVDSTINTYQTLDGKAYFRCAKHFGQLQQTHQTPDWRLYW
jgi:hypothetical protein